MYNVVMIMEKVEERMKLIEQLGKEKEPMEVEAKKQEAMMLMKEKVMMI